MADMDELWRRADFVLRGQPMFRLHQDGVITSREDSSDAKTVRLGWFINVMEGYKHAFIMTSGFGAECMLILNNTVLVDQLNALEKGIGMTWGNINPVLDDSGSLKSCVFTSKIYIYTDTLSAPREVIRTLFKEKGFDAIIIDDERWEHQWEDTKPDAFICHDSRDKDTFVDPLYEILARMPVKIFYDKYSIRLGHDIVEKIEQGLSKCRYAILLISNNFLENKSWAGHEMRALLNRQITERTERLILPIWAGVSSADVMKKSPILAKIRASRYDEGVEKVANEIFAAVTSR